jgi:hypothetical protein
MPRMPGDQPPYLPYMRSISRPKRIWVGVLRSPLAASSTALRDV